MSSIREEVANKCGKVIIADGTIWPDPWDDKTGYALWKLNWTPDAITRQDVFRILAMADAYDSLITHPALTLKEVQKKVSSIRKACAKVYNE